MCSISCEIHPSLCLPLKAGSCAIVCRWVWHWCSIHLKITHAARHTLLWQSLWLKSTSITYFTIGMALIPATSSPKWFGIGFWMCDHFATFNSFSRDSGTLPRYTGRRKCCIDLNSALVSWPSWALIPSTTNRNFFFSKLNTTYGQIHSTYALLCKTEWCKYGCNQRAEPSYLHTQ